MLRRYHTHGGTCVAFAPTARMVAHASSQRHTLTTMISIGANASPLPHPWWHMRRLRANGTHGGTCIVPTAHVDNDDRDWCKCFAATTPMVAHASPSRQRHAWWHMHRPNGTR